MTKAATFTIVVPDTCDTSDAQWMHSHPHRMKQQERLRKKLLQKTMGALSKKVDPPVG